MNNCNHRTITTEYCSPGFIKRTCIDCGLDMTNVEPVATIKGHININPELEQMIREIHAKVCKEPTNI